VDHQKTERTSLYVRKNRYVLVVDSDAHLLFYTTTLLKRFGYETSSAGIAKEAVYMASMAVPSLIITALDLKDMYGLDLIQHLKKGQAFSDIPFITLRRQGDISGEKRSLELGASECLYQPVAPERLYIAVQTATEIRPRKSIRLKTTLPVRVTNMPHNDIESTTTLDLSEGGMFLRSSEPAEVNARLSIQINLHGEIIPVDAVVVYSYKIAGGPHLQPGMGLEFVHIEPRSQELIRRFVRSEVTQGIVPMNA